MPEIAAGWAFADAFVPEDDAIEQARESAHHLGIEPVSPAVGAALALAAGAREAPAIIEIGTGTGVSGLWLLQGAPRATLTTIDSELDHQQAAKVSFAEAGYANKQVRLIAGRALDVLPRMNEASYDLVFIDADPECVIEYVEHGLKLVRRGGIVAIARVLWNGKVADPAKRDPISTGFRTLIDEIGASPAVLSSLSPAGDGLLQLVRL